MYVIIYDTHIYKNYGALLCSLTQPVFSISRNEVNAFTTRTTMKSENTFVDLASSESNCNTLELLYATSLVSGSGGSL